MDIDGLPGETTLGEKVGRILLLAFEAEASGRSPVSVPGIDVRAW